MKKNRMAATRYVPAEDQGVEIALYKCEEDNITYHQLEMTYADGTVSHLNFMDEEHISEIEQFLKDNQITGLLQYLIDAKVCSVGTIRELFTILPDGLIIPEESDDLDDEKVNAQVESLVNAFRKSVRDFRGEPESQEPRSPKSEDVSEKIYNEMFFASREKRLRPVSGVVASNHPAENAVRFSLDADQLDRLAELAQKVGLPLGGDNESKIQYNKLSDDRIELSCKDESSKESLTKFLSEQHIQFSQIGKKVFIAKLALIDFLDRYDEESSSSSPSPRLGKS